MDVNVEFLGDAALQRKLARVDGALQRKIVRTAMRAAARPVLARATQLCPVKSGRLRDSLKIRAADNQRRFGIGVHVATGKRGDLGIPEDAKYYYPAAVEFGHGNVPAQSFLRRAADETRDTGLRIAADEIRAGILREARR